MSTLTKDFTKVLVSRIYENTGGADPSTTLLSEEISVIGGIAGAIPVITYYPVSATNPSVRGIRVCTQTEVDALKAELYGGLGEPEASTALMQLLYNDTNGQPLKVYAGGNYIAAWYSEAGQGFHYFVGYDYLDPPTQDINVSALQTG